MTGLGITDRRAGTLRALAGALIRRELVLDSGAERELVAYKLQRMSGIGPWTAAYVGMRALGDPDAFPATDLGLRQALRRLGLDPRRSRVVAGAERWRPWRAYAAMHLWESLTE